MVKKINFQSTFQGTLTKICEFNSNTFNTDHSELQRDTKCQLIWLQIDLIAIIQVV